MVRRARAIISVRTRFTFGHFACRTIGLLPVWGDCSSRAGHLQKRPYTRHAEGRILFQGLFVSETRVRNQRLT
jgi:hypothetical protein